MTRPAVRPVSRRGPASGPCSGPPRPTHPPETPARPESALVEITIDGKRISAPAAATILEACRALEIDTPTLCYLENLTPVNVCRVCVVELKGARTLVPACSRLAEPLLRRKVDAVFHGHAHHGTLMGELTNGTPVYNVAHATLLREGMDPPLRIVRV